MEEASDEAGLGRAICAGCFQPIDDAGGGIGRGRRRKYHGPACHALAKKNLAAARARGREVAPTRDGRHGIDPTTSERQYDEPELEFLKAVDRYRRERRRPFPTATEILQIAISLGYRKMNATPAALPGGSAAGVPDEVQADVQGEGKG